MQFQSHACLWYRYRDVIFAGHANDLQSEMTTKEKALAIALNPDHSALIIVNEEGKVNGYALEDKKITNSIILESEENIPLPQNANPQIQIVFEIFNSFTVNVSDSIKNNAYTFFIEDINTNRHQEIIKLMKDNFKEAIAIAKNLSPLYSQFIQAHKELHDNLPDLLNVPEQDKLALLEAKFYCAYNAKLEIA